MPGHRPISPAILYWGTPVVLVTTTNPDGTTANIGPMSSAFWLGDRCMLGLARNSQTTANLLRTGECVLNLASDDMVAIVNKLAKTTGSREVPPDKLMRGYRFEGDKFALADLHAEPSSLVQPPRIRECPVHMEAALVGTPHTVCNDLDADHPARGFAYAIEVRVLKTWVVDEIRMEGSGKENRIDAEKWRPMILSFQHLYGLAPRKEGAEGSKLAEIEEESYRLPHGGSGPDVGKPV